MQYYISAEMRERIENEGVYHPPHGDQTDRYQQIREKFKEVKLLVASLTPFSREQSIALTHLDIANMEANAAIARNEKADNSD